MRETVERALTKLRALWSRERDAVQARFEAERARTTLADRVARGIALAGLTVQDTDAAPGGRVLVWVSPRPGKGPASTDLMDVRIGPGDPVRLWWNTPDEPDAVRAVVARRQRDRLGLMLDAERLEALERLEAGGANLDLEAPDRTFEAGARAIADWASARPGTPEGRRVALYYGDAVPSFSSTPPERFFDPDLNETQRAAVGLALRADDLALIHGPPGTGKTRTLVEVIRQATRRGERVLVSAASNAAVDNLVARLAAVGLDPLRIGHPARVAPEVEATTLDARLHRSEAWGLARKWNAEARQIRTRAAARSERGTLGRDERRNAWLESRRLQQDARRQLDAEVHGVVERARVVCATAVGVDGRTLAGHAFDRVVLDEATQCPDPLALVVLGRAPRATLAGDPCQLPPTVIDLDAAREGLAVTLFERLAVSRPECRAQLTVQHRMHADLMAFPSRSLYAGTLEAAPEVAARTLDTLPGVQADPARVGPLVFVDTAGRGWTDERTEADPSTRNPGNADRVASEVRRLLARGLAPTDLAVITPYDAQVRLLRARLVAERRDGLEIDSVDAFQGREKEAIVVDLVRSNDAGELGFLNDVRRMNVALTRAKRFLLVVGDSATLGDHPYYAAFLETAEALGAWTSAWDEPA
ncbi:MAG: AAA domain-containing protein [Bradymonadia bacterium]